IFSLAVLAELAWWTRKREPLFALGLIWFGAALLPSSILSLPERIVQPMAEHRAYLASCGFFMAAVVLAMWFAVPDEASPRRRLAWFGGASVVLAVFLSLTIARNRVWADP